MCQRLMGRFAVILAHYIPIEAIEMYRRGVRQLALKA